MARRLAAFALTACTSTGQSPDASTRDALITWSEHVAPIVGARCVPCHRAGAIHALTLDRYEHVAELAPDIAVEVRARRMPPTLLAPSATCHPLRDDPQRLSEAEYATVLRWINDGWPEGRPGVTASSPPVAPALEDVDAVVRMPVPYAPRGAQGEDDRCFVVNAELRSDRVLTAWEVVPGAPQAVHHVTLFALPTAAHAREAAALDAQDEAPGYPCFGGARVAGATPLVIWKPGDGPTRLPAGTGLPLRAGAPLVMQVRYTLVNGGVTDQTSVRLKTAATVPAPARMVRVADEALRLPPRTSSASSVVEADLPAAVLHGVAPVMLSMGQTLRLEVLAGPAPHCLLDLPRWDRHWVSLALFLAPLPLTNPARVRLTCRHDTRARSEWTQAGEARGDEQCAAYLYVTDAPR